MNLLMLAYMLDRIIRYAPDGDGGSGSSAGQGAGEGNQAGQGAGNSSNQQQGGQGAAEGTNAGQGAGTSQQGGQGATQQSGQSSQAGQGAGDNGDDWRASYDRLAQRYDRDFGQMAMDLFRDNYQQRERIRTLEGQTLTDDDRATFEAYRAIGQTPDQIRGVLRRQEIDRVAQTAGYNADVLATLDRAAGGGLAYEIRDEQIDGQAQRVAYVTPEGGQAQRLADYVTAEWASFLPALQPQQQGRGGTSYPAQGAGTGTGGGDMIGDFIRRNNEAAANQPNPLKEQ